MPAEILMPALSPTMEEGTLAKWHVREGDAVRTGDVIAEIETDKATMEVEAIEDGIIQSILVPEGTEHVPVNRPIATLQLEDDETPAVGGPTAAPPTAPGSDATASRCPRHLCIGASPRTSARPNPRSKPRRLGHKPRPPNRHQTRRFRPVRKWSK